MEPNVAPSTRCSRAPRCRMVKTRVSDQLEAWCPGHADLEALEEFLSLHRDTPTALHFGLASLRRSIADPVTCHSWVAAKQSGRIVGVTYLDSTGTLAFQAPLGTLCLLQELLRGTQHRVRTLTAPLRQLELVHETAGLASRSKLIDSKVKLMSAELDELRPPVRRRSSQVRRAEQPHRDLLVRWGMQHDREVASGLSQGEAYGMSCWRVRRRLQTGSLYLLFDHGVPSAMCTVSEPIRDTVNVSAVWVPPCLRGHGYGRAIVVDALLQARRRGARRAVLTVDESNLPARSAYRAVGFVHVSRYGMIVLRNSLTAATLDQWLKVLPRGDSGG